MVEKPSDLATADGQKKLGGGKNPPGGGNKSSEQKKMVAVTMRVYESSIGGGKLTPGERHFASFRHWE